MSTQTPDTGKGSLPVDVHTAAQVRAIDQHAIEQLHIPAYTLMTRAGTAALRLLQKRWPAAQCVLILCGPGNNGGDGYVLARSAREQGFAVEVVTLSEPAQLRGEARQAWQDWLAAGGSTRPWSRDCWTQADVVVDAIFGTGLSRPIAEHFVTAIVELNASGKPILALDIPSGLDADTGQVLAAAIRATCTLSLVGLKLGYYLGEGPDHIGQLCFDPLGVSAPTSIACGARRLDSRLLAGALPQRKRSAHKGSHGHVLIIGGAVGMGGAVRLGGEAALRVGAGLVTVATQPPNVAAINAARPELMCHGVQDVHELDHLMARADVIAIGPGLGTDAWARGLFDRVLGWKRTLILDADALNFLAQQPFASAATSERSNWILTPHPGEAARLLGVTTVEVQSHRLQSASALQDRYGGTVILKGANTLIVRHGELPWICDRGNPGMGTAGMGDVLTGVVAGIAAQVQVSDIAARVAVLVHAMAGDEAAASIGERGLLAGDLIARLPACVNPACS
jgi:ADP-dependent NAD(P)H-hydrate dehydratase / NAD(P)H-hydrate epimerase